MSEFGHIYLSWRQGPGHRRFIVGRIKFNANKGATFSYLAEEVEKARKEGFSSYTEFPETDKIYTENVLDIFGQRITKSERQDISHFLDFWEINHKFKDDKRHLLAHTMGLLPTDNFELLAAYHPVKNLCFITDLAGVSHLKLGLNSIAEGDQLRYEKEPTNEQDRFAIKVFKNDLHVGYIKKVHSKVFHLLDEDALGITVKAINKNGKLKNVFVRVARIDT